MSPAVKPARALAVAASQGDLGTVRRMLSEDRELARDWQPLMDACYWGRAEVVRVLLEAGADPNILGKSSHRYRPLHRVVEHKVTVPRGPDHMATARLLLEAGADPALRATQRNLTAIAVAALGGETQFLPMLMERVPEPDIHTAALVGDAGRVRDLLKADPDAAGRPDESGWTPLRYACASRTGDPKAIVEIAEALVARAGASDDALAYALGSDNPALIDLLLAHGAMVRDGDSLVHAAEEGNFRVLDLLADRGVDLHCTIGTEHHGGYTPLGCLMTIRSLRGAGWFLRRGIDPNEVGSTAGETCLHLAVRCGCAPEMLELLLAHGADPTRRDTAGRTALDMARAAGKSKAAAVLQGAG